MTSDNRTRSPRQPRKAQHQASVAARELSPPNRPKPARRREIDVGGLPPVLVAGHPAILRQPIAPVIFRDRKGKTEVRAVSRARADLAPIELIDHERAGVAARDIKGLAPELGIPVSRIYEILDVPKATAERKAASNERVTSGPGFAAIGLARLLDAARELVARSTAPEAKGFDAGKWLGRWLETPQPALGGRKAADLIATPTGLEVVERLLGSIASGAYQ